MRRARQTVRACRWIPVKIRESPTLSPLPLRLLHHLIAHQDAFSGPHFPTYSLK